MTETPMHAGARGAASRRAAGLGRTLAAFAGATLLASSSGCAPGGYYRSSQTGIDSLLVSQAELLKRVNALDNKIGSTQEQIKATRASTDTRLSDLSGRMDVIEGKIEESGEQQRRYGLKIDTMKERLSQADSARAYGSRRDSTAILDPEAAYQAAYSDLAAGRYDLARQAFTEYLRHYPDTEVSDNAQYWIGESLYATGDFEGAIKAYQVVVQRYPKGDKAAAALLKTGYAQARLGRADEARRTFQLVIQKYPRRDEARLAKERLKQ